MEEILNKKTSEHKNLQETNDIKRMLDCFAGTMSAARNDGAF